MHSIKKHLFLSSSFIASICSAVNISDSFANSTIYHLKKSDTDHASTSQRSPWTVFGGFATGYGTVSGLNYSESPRGEQLLLNANLTYEMKKWLLDTGIGWIYSNVRGKTNANQTVQVANRSGILELSPRYKLSDRWQLGPVLNLSFGTDTTFRSSVGESTSSYFAGIKAVYEIPQEQFPLRLWSQISTDISVQNQRFYLALIGIQIGFPFKSHPTERPQINAMSTQEAVSQSSNTQVHVLLDPQKVFFNTSSAQVKTEIEKELKEIADYLQENEVESTVDISGHADQRGRFQYNLKLSEKRAKAVRRSLLAGNMESSKLKVHAHSYLQPIEKANNAHAWAKNRRVELTFNQVKRPEILIEKLKPLMSDPVVESTQN
jgi:outer membrane protein OmpA-like peptidoglycan-associated protein